MDDHQVLYDNGGLFIFAHFIDNNRLDIEYDDLKFAGDYEHHLTLTVEATKKLCVIYGCDMEHLLEKVKENFKCDGRTGPFQDFCDQHELKYETFTWIS